ncbi:MAG: molybdate ABC transporter substrate-binding protein [Gammaproteobacteria bacterium]
MGMVRRLHQAVVIAVVVVMCTVTSAGAAERLSIAVDTGLKPALVDISAIFTRKTGIRVDINADASGLLAKAIENGTTYDLLLTADEDTARNLVATGLVDGDVAVFAYGRLVAVTAAGYPVDDWQQWIRSPRIERIALPDPATSPHGREAMNALQALGLIERVRGRLVPVRDAAEAVAQALDGRAAIAFAPAALLRNPEANVQVMDLPPKSYRLLAHTVGVTTSGTRRAPDASRQFTAFLASPDARDILLRHGYRLP